MSDWRNVIPMIVNKIKFQLFAKKLDNLEGISQTMVSVDKDRNGLFSRAEFKNLLARVGIFLTTQELSIVFQAFDLNGDGKVSFIEFIQSIRNSMSDVRIAAVKRTFAILDVNGTGVLQLGWLCANFSPDLHPRVRTRQKTPAQVQAEFEQAISAKSKDGSTITELDFLDFYADVSACLPNEREDHFLDVLDKSWMNVNNHSNISNERVLDIEMRVFEKVRQKTEGTDNEGITLRKKFSYVDKFGLGIIDFNQFKQAMHEIGCCFSDDELLALFNKYTNGGPKLVYSEVCDYFKDLGVGAQPNLNPVYSIYRSIPEELIENIRGSLLNRGYFSLGNFKNVFLAADKNGNGFLSRDEFVWCMKESGIDMTVNDYNKLFRFFDKNFDNQISYKEFVEFFICPLSIERLNLVNESFNKLAGGPDKQTIDYVAISQAYDPKEDPEIKAGYVTKNQQLSSFLNLFPNKHNITRNDWTAVFTDIGSQFDCDIKFASYITTLWSF